MVKNNYANAYKEVLVILNNLKKEDYDKTPKEYIEFLEENCNKDYDFFYDTSKPIEQQELLDDTKYILFGFFEKFGATELQKQKIKAFKNSYYQKMEEEKKAKYNTDVFKDISNNMQEKELFNINEVSIVEYKDSLFRRILNKIKEIFHK